MSGIYGKVDAPEVVQRSSEGALRLGLLVAILGLIGGVIITLLIHGDTALTRLDHRIAPALLVEAHVDQVQRPLVVDVMKAFGRVFSTLWVFIEIGLVTLIWLRHVLWKLIVMLAIILPGDLLHIGVQALVKRPRPPEALVQAPFTSFPSGHMMTTVFLLVWLGWLLWPAARTPGRRVVIAISLVLIGILSGGSRMYLGVHWFSDIVAGLLYAGGWSALVIGVAQRIAPAIERRSDDRGAMLSLS